VAPIFELVDAWREYVEADPVLGGITLNVEYGEWVSLLGPSGSGKTTLLNLISALDVPNRGTSLNHEVGRTGYMLQEALLLPWRTLEQNAVLGLEILTRRRSNADDWLRKAGLEGAGSLLPDAASVGMRQRVAFIRTLLCEPSLLLLDEPFASVDLETKLRLQHELITDFRRKDRSVVLVTHDVEDAVALSDRVLVLSGRPATIRFDLKGYSASGQDDLIRLRSAGDFRKAVAEVWRALGATTGLI
jgi:NitT/TauT family transport system ATP-binding protein